METLISIVVLIASGIGLGLTLDQMAPNLPIPAEEPPPRVPRKWLLLAVCCFLGFAIGMTVPVRPLPSFGLEYLSHMVMRMFVLIVLADVIAVHLERRWFGRTTVDGPS
jgi:hypothetical protein